MMEKKIEDYLHLYYGCKCKWVMIGNANMVDGVIDGYLITGASEMQIKPILRPLSDMTEEERDVLEKSFIESGTAKRTLVYEAERTAYMLKQGFDLFGLIESGLAIDKTKISSLQNPK